MKNIKNLIKNNNKYVIMNLLRRKVYEVFNQKYLYVIKR